jgi:hypothetical protein
MREKLSRQYFQDFRPAFGVSLMVEYTFVL